MTEYFIHNGIKEEGPFSISELSLKGIKSDTPIWFKGLESWTVAGKVEELKPLLPEKQTPPPFNSHISTPPNYSGVQSTAKRASRTWIYAACLALIAFFGYTITRTEGPNSPSHNNSVPVDTTVVTSSEQTAEQQREAELERTKKELRNSWSQYIKAKPGDYKYSALGGIDHLEAIVTNNTDYPLDEVKVAVKYIKENGGTYKTEYVTIYNVPAHGKDSMPAPDSSRGTGIEMEIVAAHSKDLDFCYNSDNDFNGNEDPYFCK